MLSAIVPFALALIVAVHATPARLATTLVPTAHGGSVTDPGPAIDITSVPAQANVTLSKVGAQADSAAQIFPATLLLCSTGCTNCPEGFDLSTLPHNVCLDPGTGFVAAYIEQPSNEGLPFAVTVMQQGCEVPRQISTVNTCVAIKPPLVESPDSSEYVLP
ncbi:hypothetical protein L226DRAFT_400942 [Lentinus tigrinus ALCF2SS1-7]|uniref:uncharacterized protein n=1 Tax=Lentinus tigrinus ALCF2SS1-7 TaxID=1328758 RepID=UPI0011663E8C|nr:hypothetical protein L226DRAFT_400942 [Lentinus tigrinus ALCF2SS1-7]